jgi:cyclopropane fatty-acyl-phospholipid synthase-like methyltransferase
MENFWNERYGKEAYAYGTAPNEYLKMQLPHFATGKILFPAEGEGRNAIFAARQGWEVSAFDLSGEGRRKALQLTEKEGVKISYQVGELLDIDYLPESFDTLGLIYAHFPPEVKSAYHRRLVTFLKPGGVVIFEAFSKKQPDYQKNNPHAGGPKDLAMLFSVEEIQSDFAGFDIIELSETEVKLEEGAFHNGLGSVIRFAGRKR